MERVYSIGSKSWSMVSSGGRIATSVLDMPVVQLEQREKGVRAGYIKAS